MTCFLKKKSDSFYKVCDDHHNIYQTDDLLWSGLMYVHVAERNFRNCRFQFKYTVESIFSLWHSFCRNIICAKTWSFFKWFLPSFVYIPPHAAVASVCLSLVHALYPGMRSISLKKSTFWHRTIAHCQRDTAHTKKKNHLLFWSHGRKTGDLKCSSIIN